MNDIERRELFAHRADRKLDGEDVMSYVGFKIALADAERRFCESETAQLRAENDTLRKTILTIAEDEFDYHRGKREKMLQIIRNFRKRNQELKAKLSKTALEYTTLVGENERLRAEVDRLKSGMATQMDDVRQFLIDEGYEMLAEQI